MTRFGWWMLLAILAVVGGFFLLQGEVDRPAPTRPVAGPAPSMPPAVRPATAASSGPLLIPVAGVRADQLADSFGDARGEQDERGHGAIDIMAPRGTPVLAAADGIVEKLFDSARGGHTIYVRSADRATVTYYAHLDTYAPGVAEGRPLRRGQQIATVGSTGDASPDAPHLHFEVKRMGAGEAWHQGIAVNPYPLLGGR